MALDEPQADEVAVLVNGINVLISEEIQSYADRSLVDYINGPYRQGFIVGLEGHSSC